MSDQIYEILVGFAIVFLLILAFGAGCWFEALSTKDAIDCSMCICKAVHL